MFVQSFEEWVTSHPGEQLVRDLALNRHDINNIAKAVKPNPYKYDKDEVRRMQSPSPDAYRCTMSWKPQNIYRICRSSNASPSIPCCTGYQCA